ncbi:MAG: rhodanese-related sulfurtransferase [Aggregatilineales bacterium]
MHIVIASFYKFVHLPDYEQRRAPLLDFCKSQQLRGSILLAEEGINSTVAGSRAGIDALLAYLRADDRLSDLTAKESVADFLPFTRMKVRLKKEIVTMKQSDVDPNAQVGTYIDPEDWNQLVTQSDVALIDTRNTYEVEIGTFKGAMNPDIEHFSQFPAYVQNLKDQNIKKVALFCTGGIRCEKATSYMLAEGFEEVYQPITEGSPSTLG